MQVKTASPVFNQVKSEAVTTMSIGMRVDSCGAKSEAQGRALGWRGITGLERVRHCIVTIMLIALTGRLPASVAHHIVAFLLSLNQNGYSE